MLADNTSNVYRNVSGLNNGSSSNTLESLYEFLKEAELQQYFDDLNLRLKVRSTAQLKYVDETDFQSIGMTRPEIRRLKKYFAKEFPQTAMGKIKKCLTRTTSARSTSVPRPDDLSNRMNSFTAARFNVNGQSTSPMDSDDLTTIASVTNFSIASNGTSDSYDWRQLGSKYLIIHHQVTLGPLIRHGDFADLYKGSYRPTQAQIQVAVKVFNKISLKNDGNDFAREVLTNCSLDHTNVATLYGLCIDEHSIKMIIEFGPCGSLMDCLLASDSKIKYPITVLHNFVVQVSHGMSYLEEKRVIHGRLTANNILIFPDNKVKVTDVGVFRAQTSLVRSTSTDAGLWLSPEVCRGHIETMASDVWAFGVLLWEIYNYCKHSPSSQMDESVSSLMDMRLPYLPQPDICPNMTFHLMKICWTDLPRDRPSFYQLSSELVRLVPEQVVALVDGPDVVPSSHRSEETNEPSDDSYSSLTEMQMLYYKTGDIIVVLDRSMNQYKELWRGCLLTGECGYFKWANMRAVGVNEALFLPPKTKVIQPSPVTSIRSNGRSIGEAFSKIHISRREDKRRHGRLSVDMISGPQNDFRHVGHVGANGDVFGDVTSLYASPGQQKTRSGSVSTCSKSEYNTSFSEASSIISSTTLNAAGDDTPPYATIDSGPGTVQSNKSKESSKKITKEVKPVVSIQTVPPLPPIRSHSEDESNTNIYLDDLTIGSNFLSGNEGFSLFDELSKQWEMQCSKLESPICETKPDECLLYDTSCRKSPMSNEDYSEVDEDNVRSSSIHIPSESVFEKKEPIIKKTQRSASVMESSSTMNGSTAKSNIFQKFRVFGSSKPSKPKDLSEGHKSPIYSKLNKNSKSKKEKDDNDKKKDIISNPIFISCPLVSRNEVIDDNFQECSSEVSSLQPSPRDSEICLANSGCNPYSLTDPSPSFNRQHSNITTSSKGRTCDSTITSVSPASSFASLSSTHTTNALQGGAALRALRKGDCVFRASSTVNALNRKRPSIGQLQGDSEGGTMTRTRQPSLPLTSSTVKMSIDRNNFSNSRVDNYEQLDELLDSSATTPIASEQPNLRYTDLSLVGEIDPKRVNTSNEDNQCNKVHSRSQETEYLESRGLTRPSNLLINVAPPSDHKSFNAVIKAESAISSSKTDVNGRLKLSNSNYSYNYSNNTNMFSLHGDDDEVAL